MKNRSVCPATIAKSIPRELAVQRFGAEGGPFDRNSLRYREAEIVYRVRVV